MATEYSLKVVEQDGAGGFDEIAGTVLEGVPATGPLTTVRNGMGQWGLRLPVDHPVYTALLDDWLYRELQVYREGSDVPVWWGVPVAPSKSIGSRVASVTFAEVIPWLLSHRLFGRANRRNLLSDPGFESGAFAPNWTTTGVDTASIISHDSYTGGRCAELEEASDNPDASVQQTVSFTAGGFGDLITLAAYYEIVSWLAPAFENRGLFIEWRIGGVLQDWRFTTIDARDALRAGEWIRAEIPHERSVWIPPNVAATINARGQAIKGIIRWDHFILVLMESVSTGVGGSDIGTFAAAIVNHAQDAAYDKDDADILTDMPTTGHVIQKAHQFAEAGNIWVNGIGDLVDREDGLDFGWVYGADGQSRTIKGYDRTGGAAGIGADRTGEDTTLGGDIVADYGYALTGGEAAGNVRVAGDGDGPDREEGSYLNPALFGGRSLEKWMQAPAGTTVRDLDGRAAKAGKQRERPGTFHLKLRPGVRWGDGDYLTLPSYDAGMPAGDYRVINTATDVFSDTMTVGVEKLAS